MDSNWLWASSGGAWTFGCTLLPDHAESARQQIWSTCELRSDQLLPDWPPLHSTWGRSGWSVRGTQTQISTAEALRAWGLALVDFHQSEVNVLAQRSSILTLSRFWNRRAPLELVRNENSLKCCCEALNMHWQHYYQLISWRHKTITKSVRLYLFCPQMFHCQDRKEDSLLFKPNISRSLLRQTHHFPRLLNRAEKKHSVVSQIFLPIMVECQQNTRSSSWQLSSPAPLLLLAAPWRASLRSGASIPSWFMGIRWQSTNSYLCGRASAFISRCLLQLDGSGAHSSTDRKGGRILRCGHIISGMHEHAWRAGDDLRSQVKFRF